MVEAGDLVFDIGALDGKYTDRYLEAGARVVAVEPQPNRAENLRTKYKDNPNVQVVCKAVGRESGKGNIYYTVMPWLTTMVPEKWYTGRFHGYRQIRSEEVEITTLDDLIKTYGMPQFIKIDVEGYEVEVLAGLSQAVEGMCYEFTREYLDDAATCASYLDTLGNYEYAISYYEENQPGEYRKMVCVMTELWNSKLPQLWGDIYARLWHG